jgi:hypothetical protein
MATKHQGELDVAITKIELTHAVSAGVWLGSIIDGIVPVYEEHLARLERHIDLDTWAKMDVDEKAMIIAIRRITLALNNLQAEAEIAKSEKK